MVAASRMVGSQEEALPGRGHGWHAASPVGKDHLSQLTRDDDLASVRYEVAQLSSAAQHRAGCSVQYKWGATRGCCC